MAQSPPKDTKDWTWTITRRCDECGVTAGEFTAAQIAPSIERAVRPWQQVLRGRHVHERPSPRVWSPLEYACHVRDVCRVFDGRVHLMLDRDDPPFDDWDQDAAARAGHYADQDPARVAGQLDDAATGLVASYRGVRGDQWGRTGQRGGGARFTVLTLGQYCLHDLHHHLHDVGVAAGV